MKEYNLIIYEDFNILEVVARTIISIVCLYVLQTNIEGYDNIIIVMGIWLILYAINPFMKRFTNKRLIKYVKKNEEEDLKPSLHFKNWRKN